MLGCLFVAFALCNPNYAPPVYAYSGGYAYAQSGVVVAQPVYVVQPAPVMLAQPVYGWGGPAINVNIGRRWRY